MKNDFLWKSSFGKSPRHQLNQEGLLFNYLGRRVGLVSPPCASVPDILSAAINERREREKKKESSISGDGHVPGIDFGGSRKDRESKINP